jgi:hypothetical protein
MQSRSAHSTPYEAREEFATLTSPTSRPSSSPSPEPSPTLQRQNRLDLTNGKWHKLIIEWERREIGFIPYRPLGAWDDPTRRQVLMAAASRRGANTNQIALAWLLEVSPVTLPIPGTATPKSPGRHPRPPDKSLRMSLSST